MRHGQCVFWDWDRDRVLNFPPNHRSRSRQTYQSPVRFIRFDKFFRTVASLGSAPRSWFVPDDIGQLPTYQTLVGLDREKVRLDIQRRDGSDLPQAFQVCFPRISFVILSPRIEM
ncbi:hypothetical protein CROQUDRAFT_459150 [Cronartium quercuum f. sp. fusiforme G11]|uniref:Uncharacterized protein n=1 Tax=Cronartium quercuum f. sp. fusiforme G11 TaxID=708437 RepID=A0A9P6NIG2_9BASI|nr:hypothetical protein CROQUDRAFT_459150 [Cronartium quercuum f. sp. fusiforme G11]